MWECQTGDPDGKVFGLLQSTSKLSRVGRIGIRILLACVPAFGASKTVGGRHFGSLPWFARML